jgi:lipopolysaccharide/colanic/teichoic acid biosynthesis glycosyltransferase
VDAEAVSNSLWAKGGKRLFDICITGVAVVLLSPVFLLTALGVKMSSRGPLLFRQVRTGLGGRPFRPCKFRSMRGDRTPDPTELVPLDHPEITAIGRFIRRTKIDELPQLFSVLGGDMSLVGPRPTLPDQTEKYNDFQCQRLLVRPGLTGLAQVNGNTIMSWDERIKYDVHYVRHHGFWMDMGILLKTVLVVILGEDRFSRPFSESPYAHKQTADPASR